MKTKLAIVYMVLVLACNSASQNIQSTDSRDDQNASFKNQFIDNLNKSRPYFKVAIDTLSEMELRLFSNPIYPDTTKCRDFIRQRQFIGNIENAKAIIEDISTSYLKTGNLKLWVCNLSDLPYKLGDTLLVSASVYDIFGNERAVGLPSVLFKISVKR